MNQDSSTRVHTIACPTLIIHGTEDAVLPYGNAERLANKIKHSRLLRQDKIGHMCKCTLCSPF